MPAITVPAWFNADEYAAQKVIQMNAIGYGKAWLDANGGGATAWTVELFTKHLESFGAPIEGATFQEMCFSNFEACNAGPALYANRSDITVNDVNVSPNSMFDIPVYLQMIANAQNAGASTDAPAGTATTQTVLNSMFNTDHTSVWEYYSANWDQDLNLNPSNKFDTQTYLTLRAAAMEPATDVNGAVAAIKASGLNPVEDFFANGASFNITADAIAVEAGSEVNPATPGWLPWGDGSVTPVETDPYDVNAEAQAILKGETGPYEGIAGKNTHFTADWTDAAHRTLNENDVITGSPDTLNSLIVEMGSDWNGFAGTGADVFNKGPNVTGVGRIVLNHFDANTERSFAFDAKNISEDAVRFDLNSTGTGTFQLSSLTDKVTEVRISDVASADGDQKATQINYATGAFKGKNDTLTLGIDNVCSDGKGTHKVTSNVNTIENLVVNSLGIEEGGLQNQIDVSGIEGVKNLTVTGAANIDVTAAKSTKVYDASQASGNVDFHLSNAGNYTITGGVGTDTVTFVGSASGTANAAKWTGIEHVAFDQTGDVTVNAKGAAGLDTFWVNNKVENTVNNLTADNVQVYQTLNAAETIKTTTIDGKSLGNIAWISAGPADGKALKANLASNATGDATITLTGEDTFATGSSFNFSKAANTIKIDAPNVSNSFAIDIVSVTLAAPKATALEVALTGGLTLAATTGNGATDLASIETVKLNLTNEHVDSSSHDHDTFDMSGYALSSAQTVQISAGEETVKLGNLGATGNKANPFLTLDAQDAYDFTVGEMKAGLGGDVRVNITAENQINMGNITTETNKGGNDMGDVMVSLTGDKLMLTGGVDAQGNTVGPQIDGGALNLDFSGITGSGVGTSGNELELKSSEGIRFNGTDYAASGTNAGDFIKILKVGAGTTSTLSLGEGGDQVTVDVAAFEKASQTATINIDLGEGDGVKDTVSFTGATANTGYVLVDVVNAVKNTTTGDTISGVTWTTSSDLANINAALKALGLSEVTADDFDATDSSTFKIGDNFYSAFVSADGGYIVECDADIFA